MKKDIYEQVTNQIIKQMENGIFPWVQPWSSKGLKLGLPQNASTKNRYSGVNILLLWGTAFDRGYQANNWLTFKQAQGLGGKVRKGEKGAPIIKYGRFVPASDRALPVDEQRERVYLQRYYVFNVDQIDGLPENLMPVAPDLPERQQIEAAERVAAATGADIRNGGARAFYVPADDFIQLPPQPAYHDQVNYYRTMFHELGHWTGHKSRLDRFEPFQTKAGYAKEELIAELCAAFTCAQLGIKPTVRHADYLGNWLKAIKGDKKMIFKAASAASKASDFILNSRPDDVDLVKEPAKLIDVPAHFKTLPPTQPAFPQAEMSL